MFKTLKRIDTNLERQREAYGSPSNFADYVLRVAIAVKAKGFLVQTHERGGWSYDDSDFETRTAIDARYFIETKHREHLEPIRDDEARQAEIKNYVDASTT